MSITATEIQNIRFSEARRGYNPDEVDEFLEQVASDVDNLNRALAEAATRLSEADQRTQTAEERAQTADDRARVAEEQLANAVVVKEASAATPSASEPSPRAEGTITEEVIAKAFIAAQVSADNLKEEARKEAEKLYREADAKAKDIVRDAHGEREKMLGEIEHLRGISEKFRTEFLSLINHYSADAQRRFTEFNSLVPEDSGSLVNSAVGAMQNTGRAQGAAPVKAAAPAAAPTLVPAYAPAPAQKSNPGATTAMPMPVAFALDDDLEIEEID